MTSGERAFYLYLTDAGIERVPCTVGLVQPSGVTVHFDEPLESWGLSLTVRPRDLELVQQLQLPEV